MRTRRRTRLRSKICDTCKKVIDTRDNIVNHLKQCQNFYEITENSDDDDTKVAENFNDDNEIKENSNDDNDITENSNDDKDITGNAVDDKEIAENSDDDNEIIVLDDFFGISKTNSDQISRDFSAQRQTLKRLRSDNSSQEQKENKRQHAASAFKKDSNRSIDEMKTELENLKKLTIQHEQLLRENGNQLVDGGKSKREQIAKVPKLSFRFEIIFNVVNNFIEFLAKRKAIRTISPNFTFRRSEQSF